MSGTIITPVATWHDTLGAPLDGELASSGDIISKFVQPLADNTAYNKAAVASEATSRSSGDAALSGRIVSLAGANVRPLSVAGIGFSIGGSSKWYQDGQVTAQGRQYWTQGDIADHDGNSTDLVFEITDHLRLGMTISSFGAVFRGASGHTALPGMPQVLLWHQRWDYNESFTVVETATDSIGTVELYEDEHMCVASPGHVVVAQTKYFLTIRGEAGVSGQEYIAGLQMSSLLLGTTL